MSSTANNLLKRAAFGTALCERLLIDNIDRDNSPNQKAKREGDNIVILGGELFNKGAQAMTFTVVDQLRRRFPEKSIYLFSEKDYYRDESEKQKYNFNILPWTINTRTEAMSATLPTPSKVSKSVKKEVIDVLKNSAFLIDINGYALSSQWGFDRSMLYMANIAAAHKFSIPIYIFPQSIGPFDYETYGNEFLEIVFKSYLDYPEIICPREPDGQRWLNPYTNGNVKQQFDIVLQYNDYNLNNVYRDAPEFRDISIQDNAVGIIPNSQVDKRKDGDRLYRIYGELIKEIVNQGKEVYILRHSVEDLDICKKIKEETEVNEKVHLLDEDYNAIELEKLINRFEFIIGSRYHSLVHAYKNSVPVIAIGWAKKYEVLLEEFNQSEYFFEGRNKIVIEDLVSSVGEMADNIRQEEAVIDTKRKEILEEDLVTELFGAY